MATMMMKCGHAANAVRVRDDGTRSPACAICVGLTPGAYEIDPDPPLLAGRRARCSYFGQCGTERDSSPSEAFFEHLPNEQYDRMYCGCFGWD